MRMCHPHVEDDTAHDHYALLGFLSMMIRIPPQLFHPHVDDVNGHVEDEHPIHPLQGNEPDSEVLPMAKTQHTNEDAHTHVYTRTNCIFVRYSTSSATQHRRLLDIVGY
jgi:hypothetical protein